MYLGFIWMVDDNYAVKPFELSDITHVHMHAQSFTGNKSAPTSWWSHDKWKTRVLLDENGLPHVNYTTHYPFYVESRKMKEIFDRFSMRSNSYVIEDVYFNYFKHEEPTYDHKVRLGVWNRSIYEREFESAMADPNIKFVCNSTEGWSRELEEGLRKVCCS
jgi:hypothetical protein